MATLTITVPDAVVPRIRAAFGHQNPSGPDWVPATSQELQDAIKAFVRDRTVNYEAAQAELAKRTATSQEAQAW